MITGSARGGPNSAVLPPWGQRRHVGIVPAGPARHRCSAYRARVRASGGRNARGHAGADSAQADHLPVTATPEAHSALPQAAPPPRTARSPLTTVDAGAAARQRFAESITLSHSLVSDPFFRFGHAHCPCTVLATPSGLWPGLWPMVRRKVVFGRYAVLRCLWHEVRDDERSNR
eukprot:38497-Prymnesium_polylepis.1